MMVALVLSLAIPVLQGAYLPQRVFDTRLSEFSDFESMLADLARADVVFVGEQHDDPNTHRLELAIVEGLTQRGVPVVIGMGMFERDVQSTVDQYVGGKLTEEQFVKDSRAWPRYASDYKPLIEFARANHLPVIASDIPRRIAADVGKSGLSVIDGLGDDRRLAAREMTCPTSGDYYDRFAEAILSLLNDPVERARLGQNARQHAVEQYSWEQYTRRLEEIYLSVVR